MASYKDDNRDTPNNYCYNRFRRILNTWILCLASFSVTILGGLLLTWWELRYHPTNSQLWMVPFGLIFFITPLLIWSSLCLSSIFTHSNSNPSSPVPAEANSLCLSNV